MYDPTFIPVSTKRFTGFFTNITPKMSVTSKRSSYSANFKLKVIQFAKEHDNKAAAREFGPPPASAMIRRWRKEVEELSKRDEESCS